MFDEESCLLVKSLDDDEDNTGSVAEILEEEVGRLLNILDRENVDWRVEADEEDEVFRAVGVVDEFEVPGLLVIARDKDSLVEADDEDEICRVVGMVDKVLGWLVEIFDEEDADDEGEATGAAEITMLAKVVSEWDFDRVVEADEVSQLLEMTDGGFNWLIKGVDKGGVDGEVDWLVKVEATLFPDVLESNKEDLTNEELSSLLLCVLLGETLAVAFFVENGLICWEEVIRSKEAFVWADVDCPSEVKNNLLDDIFFEFKAVFWLSSSCCDVKEVVLSESDSTGEPVMESKKKKQIKQIEKEQKIAFQAFTGLF